MKWSCESLVCMAKNAHFETVVGRQIQCDEGDSRVFPQMDPRKIWENEEVGPGHRPIQIEVVTKGLHRCAPARMIAAGIMFLNR
jgi:hypothetical protein